MNAAQEQRTFGRATVVRLPAMVRGTLRIPAWPLVGEVTAAVRSGARVVGPTSTGSFLLSRAVIDRATFVPTGEIQILLLPAIDPGDLPEPDPAAAIRDLMDLPVKDVCDFVDAVGAHLRVPTQDYGAGVDARSSGVDDRWHAASRAAVAGMFDGAGVRAMLEVELGATLLGALDRWTPVAGTVRDGVTAQMAMRHKQFRFESPGSTQPRVRGLPTTQLHITAGNSPVVPATSLLWAWASKGAVVLKPAADLAALASDLAAAVAAVDGASGGGARHPLARHTTIAYWPGGNSQLEADLMAPGAFGRRVVWGSAQAIASVAQRSPASDLIMMRPRHALSLLCAQDDLAGAARRAVADSVVADQGACMSSLLHVVEGSPRDADAYADQVVDVLASWDTNLPHRTSDRVAAELQNLRRGLLATADWRLNGSWPRPSSLVVRCDRSVDLERHPGGRLILVRAVPDLRVALPSLLAGDVSHVGVSAHLLTDTLRDDLVAQGVDNVLPLGAAEQTYAGRPHDGMRVLTRLVRWVNG